MKNSLLTASLLLAFAQTGLAQWGPGTSVGPGISGFLKTGDLTNDGNTDVLAIRSGQIWWYENTGGGAFEVPVMFPNSLPGVSKLIVIDHDQDGWNDVVVGGATNTHWFRNLGGGDFAFAAPLFGILQRSPALDSGDWNGDGQPDYVTGTVILGSLEIALHESNPMGAHTKTNILLPPAFVESVDQVDWDGDDLVDVIASTEDGVYWVEMQSGGTLTASLLPVANSFYIETGDMDGDGDQDLVKLRDGGFVGWYENTGDGGIGALTEVSSFILTQSPPFVADFDLDGDLDIAGTDDLQNFVFWVENLGQGVLGPMQFIVNPSASPVASTPGDMDRDGDLDVVIGTLFGPNLLWYENGFPLAPVVCPAELNSSMSRATLSAVGSRFAADNDVTLLVENAPPGQFTLMQNSRGFKESFPGNSAGVRCVAAPFHFYRGLGEVAQTDANGMYDITLDLTATPDVGGFAPVLAGETWYFQAWFRDRNPAPTSNFSDGVMIQFR